MKKIVLLFLSALVGTAIPAQNTANLTLNLEKNKVYRLKSTSEQTLTQTVNGVQQTTGINSNSSVSIKVVDATPDLLIAEVRFDTLITITNTMGKISNINSTSEGNMSSAEAADVMSCIMNRLSKNALYVKMDYTGKVMDIVNAKMLSDVILKDTALISGPTASITKAQIRNMTGNEALKSMVEPLIHNLPGKQLSKGDTWVIAANNLSGGMSLDITTNYVLNGIKDRAATVTAESNFKTAANADPLEYGGLTITYDDLSGLGKSNMVIDAGTGLIIESNSKTHIAGNLNVNVQNNNIQIPMVMDGESKVIALP